MIHRIESKIRAGIQTNMQLNQVFNYGDKAAGVSQLPFPTMNNEMVNRSQEKRFSPKDTP
jgi:hypothetical protein